MIDKVEVRIPARSPYTREFAALRRDVLGTKRDPFRPSTHYQSSGDLREFGYPTILHSVCRHGTGGNHKVELVDSGLMTLARMHHEIERIFDVDAARLNIMRLDLAADVRGVPVSWFSGHVRARWKRWVADFSDVEYTRMGKGEIQTVYFGKRPNCYRIYDKIAEWRSQYIRLKRRADAGYPSFEDVFGYPEMGQTLTRVERQIGGSRVPEQVDTFGKLRYLPDFNPFVRLEFIAPGKAEPTIEECGFGEFAIGMFLRDRAESWGVHRLRAWLNHHADRNAKRLIDRYHNFLPAEAGITAERLFETYRESVSKQLAA
ncbi:MAG TPA: hypothetical protein VH639_16455 [Bryobacteraceae bacterium]|jgi:hypothetical protein